MATIGQLLLPRLTSVEPTREGRKTQPDVGSPAEVRPEPGAASRADLSEADGLISDLAALIDAGLVVVQPRVVGPARYALASDPGNAE